MKKVLLITSSPRGESSHSRDIANKLVERFKTSGTDVVVTVRDLSQGPIPHIGASFVHAAYTPESDRSEEQRAALKLSDELIDELFAADILVISTGMINFGISSGLKAWIDHVIRAGKTFAYGESGLVPLVTGKKAYIVAASGGIYSSGPMRDNNFHDQYLSAVLGFVGIQDLETILLEGVAYGPEALEAAINGATERLEALSF